MIDIEEDDGGDKLSWEESHPGLKGKYDYAENFPKSWYVVPMMVVCEETLDKHRVRKAIRKCSGQSDKNEPFQLCWSDELLRELGL